MCAHAIGIYGPFGILARPLHVLKRDSLCKRKVCDRRQGTYGGEGEATGA